MHDNEKLSTSELVSTSGCLLRLNTIMERVSFAMLWSAAKVSSPLIFLTIALFFDTEGLCRGSAVLTFSDSFSHRSQEFYFGG